MNESPSPPPPDPPRQELLAAYADGELDPATRQLVERWLTDHEQEREDVRSQWEFSPRNWEFWSQADPIAPTEATWTGVHRSILAALHCRKQSVETAVRVHTLLLRAGIGIGAAVIAAALVLWLASPREIQPDNRQTVVANAAAPGEAALPLATDDDVELLRVPGTGIGYLPVGLPPLAGAMVLAGSDDVELEELDIESWPDGEPKMVTGHGDAPLIYSARSR